MMPSTRRAQELLTRRSFLGAGSAALLGAALPLPAKDVGGTFARHIPATRIQPQESPLPDGKRAPFGWKVTAMTQGTSAPLVLRWDDWKDAALPTHLRLTAGTDERDVKIVEAFLAESGRSLGRIEVRYASQFQIYQLPISPSDWKDWRREGVALRLSSGSTWEILSEGERLPDALRPHLLLPGSSAGREEFYRRLESLAGVQQFGWMEGCVLDGLIDLGRRGAARQHLDLFISKGRLIYEGPTGAPCDGRIYGIEGSLPFAALARLEPNHPLLELAIDFWNSRKGANGAVQDPGSISSEGAYTVGYAMAELARARESEELMRLALDQVRIRQKACFNGRVFHRTRSDSGEQGNRNWARGIAWQLLGMARTLTVARKRTDISDLTAGLRQLGDWVCGFQRPDGLWSVFVDEPSLLPDTGGSAGIAAALAIGVNHGWLEASAKAAAVRALTGLERNLTPDGFLTGVSQSNKGGESLQRSDYRVIYQMGMGLMAQLIAALKA